MNKLVYLGLSILDNSNIEINEYSMAMQNQSAEIKLHAYGQLRSTR